MAYSLELFVSVLEQNIDNRGKTPPLSQTGYPLIEVKHIQEDHIYPVFKDTKYVDQATWDTWFRAHLEPGDILFSTVGSIARSCMVPKKPKFCIAQNVLGFRVNRLKADPRFVYYAMNDSIFLHEVHGRTIETVQKSIKVHDLKTCHIPLPPLPEQRAIAHILGMLDDKIDLNRQMNETLEAMAQTIFNSWFVDFDPVRAKAEGRDTGLPQPIADMFPDSFDDSELGEIPKGWEVGVLDQFINVVLGGDWGEDKPTEEKSEPARCIRGADIPDLQIGGTGKMPVRFLKPSSLEKRRLNDGDIVVEISGGSPTQSTARSVLISRGLLDRLQMPLVCSNFCRSLKLKSPALSKFIYLWLRSLYANDDFLQFENGTTGIKNFAFTLFSSSYKFRVPPLDILNAFDQQVSPLFNKQQASAVETATLAALRDALLPKLISGELMVKDAERFVTEETTKTEQLTSAIYTIGHSNHSIQSFINLLKKHNITAVVDVRSSPVSRRNPQFNKDVLSDALKKANISYVFLGKELGGRPDDPTYYHNGQVDYSRMSDRPIFREGIERLLKGKEKYRMALLCAEREPLDCHRTILISRNLAKLGIPVKHILADGNVEEHQDTERRLIKITGLEPNFFNMSSSDTERIQQAYDKRAQQIAYKVGIKEDNENAEWS